jgi:preprotein translocase subunit SecD
VPSSAQASDALAATAFARQGGSTGVRKKEAVVDAASVAAAYVHARSITQKKKAKEEPCGILSTYARRVFAAQVVETTQTPVVVDLETTTERAARHSCATTSAQTEVVFFVDENKAPTATRKSKKDKKDKKARKENKPKKSSEKRKKRTTIAAPRDDLGDDDSSVESLVAPGEFLYGQTVTRSLPGDQRFAKLASASVDEADADNAVETLRATPDDLYKRLHSELALYDEMGDISSELDAMRLARDTFDAEQGKYFPFTTFPDRLPIRD